MDKEKLFDALDGLFAYDGGATDSGIHDESLRKEVFDFIREEAKRESTFHPSILTEFVKQHYADPPYGLEDIKEFIEWLEGQYV